MSMTKRYLNTDPFAVAACLNPAEIAKENQGCHIFNPALSKYVCVTSSSPLVKEQDSNFVETDSDIRGHGKQFKLELCTDGKFRIKTLDEDGEHNGYLYLSGKIHSGVLHRSANILRSTDIIKEKEQQYLFEITESDSQQGLFKFVCCGKTLFASKGIHKYILADDTEMSNSSNIWFQFNLKTRVLKKSLTGVEECHDLSHKDTSKQSFSYNNDGCKDVYVKFDRKKQEFINVDGCSQDETFDSTAVLEEDDLLPANPILVEANCKLTIQLTSELTAFTKLKEVKIEIENGKTFSAFQEQNCFRNRREWSFL